MIRYTSRLVVRTCDPSFAERMLDYHWRNRTFFEPWTPRVDPSYFTLAAHTARLEQDERLLAQGQGVRFWLFAVEDVACKTVIGDIGVANIVRGAFQSCHLGYKIDETRGGAGLMTEAVANVVEYAFGELKLHRIEANIMPRNARSLRVVEKLGFQSEGLARKYLKINDVWEDHIHYVLLNESLE